MCFAAACGSATPASEKTSLVQTSTACPEGQDRDVRSYFSAECAIRLFNGAIRLPDLGQEYRAPAFDIFTPVQPTHLTATYPTRDLDERLTVEVHIDAGRPVGREASYYDTVDGNEVLLGPSRRDVHVRYYWEWNGWWYTLDTPDFSDDQRAKARVIIADMVAR